MTQFDHTRHTRMQRVSAAPAAPVQFTEGRSHNTPECPVADREAGSPTDRPASRYRRPGTHFPSMTDEELLSWFRVTRNNITTTALEEELAERLAVVLDAVDLNDDLVRHAEQLEQDKEELENRVGERDDEIYDLKTAIEDLKTKLKEYEA